MLVVFSTKKSRTQIWVQIPFSKVMGSAVKVGDSCGIQEQTYRACWQVLHKPQEYQMSAAGLGALWGEPGAALCRAQPILVTPGPGLGHLRGNSKDRACPGSPAFPSFLPTLLRGMECMAVWAAGRELSSSHHIPAELQLNRNIWYWAWCLYLSSFSRESGQGWAWTHYIWRI